MIDQRSHQSTQTETGDATDFGYETVPVSEKAKRVAGVFDSVAGRYDLMNDLMSGGVHRLWKATLLDWLDPRPGQTLLDVAGGTGDIAFRFLERANTRPGAPAKSILCDINANMLLSGKAREQAASLAPQLAWVCGNAECLPLPDRHVDAYTIAFGIRNVTHIDRALREARRVLKPGGRFLCLEFSDVQVPILDVLYKQYSFSAIPEIGRLVTGDGDAYRYLVESIQRFPNQKRFAEMIEDAGFSRVSFRNLSGGISALHSGWRT